MIEINAKLAEYNLRTGEFMGFVKYFWFSASTGSILVEGHESCSLCCRSKTYIFDRDYTGSRITFGSGRFVLCNDSDIVLLVKHSYRKKNKNEIGYGKKIITQDLLKKHLRELRRLNKKPQSTQIIGNLHENPELYDKLK